MNPPMEPSCARCGSSVAFLDCWQCEGEGYCDVCSGDGGWLVCLSTEEWCNAHPLKGREGVSRGEVEGDPE